MLYALSIFHPEERRTHLRGAAVVGGVAVHRHQHGVPLQRLRGNVAQHPLALVCAESTGRSSDDSSCLAFLFEKQHAVPRQGLRGDVCPAHPSSRLVCSMCACPVYPRWAVHLWDGPGSLSKSSWRTSLGSQVTRESTYGWQHAYTRRSQNTTHRGWRVVAPGAGAAAASPDPPRHRPASALQGSYRGSMKAPTLTVTSGNSAAPMCWEAGSKIFSHGALPHTCQARLGRPNQWCERCSSTERWTARRKESC